MQARPRVVVLLNAAAGALEARGSATLLDALTSAFEHHRIFATLKVLHGRDLHAAASQAVQRVENKEFDAIVVGGGDGSVRTVTHALAGSNVPLGILPLGTLNHFARDLGIPATINEAVALIASGKTRLIDVGAVNGEIFVNNASLGIYPYLVLERELWRRRQGLAKWSAMIMAGLGVIRRLPIRHLSISTEGLVEAGRSHGVFIGNNEYSLTAQAFGRRARLDRGELCIYVTKAHGSSLCFGSPAGPFSGCWIHAVTCVP
ncbi:diacylglycerol/lipid kinase family protein [Microvirga brassicacearum]|uniref:Diacylglycerol kinase family lipid kinase n=1 Tax=Microvirga brassicacearum TaxID=2580413 RepID=A0A5N3P764_9HYPH|nr:diacylglycerol kinase family protein [Microvirga brassicacearum]KAB0265578.1 diacylglycerol kinase family lipid kinase [Microvirga brassicacearum]